MLSVLHSVCRPLLFCSSLFLLLVGGPCLRLPDACATWGENYGSVHFNSGEPDFGTPPRRAIYPGEDSRPGSSGGMSGGPVYTEFSEGEVANREANIARRRTALHRAWESTLARGNWRLARAQIGQEIQTLGATGSLRDRAEVLDAAQPLLATTPALSNYLHTYFWGMRVSDGSDKRSAEAATAFTKVLNSPAPTFLRAHCLYQLASLAYERKQGKQALELYQQMCRTFPESSKKPAALLMAARAGLLLPGSAEEREAAKRALDQFRQEFPQHRFRRAIQGLYGRYWFLTGQYQNAANVYLRLNDVASLEVVRPQLSASVRQRLGPRFLTACLYGMERATNYYEYFTALKGVDREMQELTPQTAKQFVGYLFQEPGLASPYFYYRLYCTDTMFPHAGYELTDEDRKANARIIVQQRNLLRLAERIADRSDATERLPVSVRLRLAQVYYQERRYRSALRWVNSSFGVPRVANRWRRDAATVADRALYVRGAIYQKQRRTEAAVADFERLLDYYPTSPLRPAAREELAILYEAQNRNSEALDQYFALGYDQDVAYLLDVRMTTAQVAAYCAAHPRHPKHALLTYSLGVRYLRDDNLPAARRTLRQLSHKQYAVLAHPTNEWGYQFEDESLDPMGVIDALVALREKIARAQTREERAMAMYRHASYHYKRGLLLFYNAALWQGRRIFNFDVFWNERQMTPADRAAIRRHMYQHEVYVRVIDQCREIADRYPNTSAAPLALYRAACASSHLSGLNQWWQSETNYRHLDGQAAALLRRLARRYPKHPLNHNARKYAAVFAKDENAVQEAWMQARANHEEKARAY